MRCSLPYGSRRLDAELPESAAVLVPPAAPPHRDPHGAVDAALRAPHATPPLSQLASGRRTACIVVPDATRPAVGAWVVPALDKVLRDAALVDIEILIATGTHRAAQAHEVEQLVGPELAARARVRSHDAVEGVHEHVGDTAAGTPVWIDRGYMQADLRIVVGVVEPHLMAGYSGGAKSVCPGIARLDSVRAVHRASVARARVGPGIVRGNPFRREVVEAAKLAGVDFSVQCCVNRAHSLAYVAAGGLDASVENATRFAALHSRVATARSWDVVIVSGGGAPLDRTLYQAAKGWAAGAAVVRGGGDLILVAEMADGVGSPEFAALLEAGLETYDRNAADFDAPRERTGQWMLQHILQARARARLHAICSLPPERLRRIGISPHGSVEDAVAALCGGRATRRVLALPHGPYCVAAVGDQLVTLEGAAAL